MRLMNAIPRISVLVVFVAILPARVNSAPASPNPFVDRQPDGQPVRLYVRGDEFFYWFEDLNGYTVVQEQGRYVYAALHPQGVLAPTMHEVGKANPARLGFSKKLLPSPETIKRVRDSSPLRAATGPGAVQGPPTSGNVRHLVLLARFSNHSAGNTQTQTQHDLLYNAPGGHPTWAPTGSVRDFYLQNSYNLLTLNSDVMNWVVLPHTESYYTNGHSGLGGYPRNGAGMVEDAVLLAEQMGVDFAPYDNDGDGFVDLLTVVHSGTGAELGGSQNRMWSHVSGIPPFMTNDAVQVSIYATVPDRYTNQSGDICRVGVICHEIGHLFGLPDLYDQVGQGQGIGRWGLMGDSWGFGGNQRHPPYFCAWSKLQLGWVLPFPISGTPGIHTSQDAHVSPTVHLIDHGYRPGEYLLIENRQPTSFESTIPQGGGLAIWHIDDNNPGNVNQGYPSQSGWPQNDRHYQVSLIQRDTKYNLEKGNNPGDGGDLYRGGFQPNLLTHLGTTAHAYEGGNYLSTNNTIVPISNTGPSMDFEYERCAEFFDFILEYAGNPPPRSGHAMAAHTANASLVLFGGGPPPVLDDTWVYNGIDWIQQFPGTVPAARHRHAMAYHNAMGRTIIFGGANNVGLVVAGTWAWNGVNWQQVALAGGPQARHSHGMAYDVSRQEIVLYGGEDGLGNPLNDTWVLTGNPVSGVWNWTQRSPSMHPPALFGHQLAYDRHRKVTVLFGGDNASLPDAAPQTWEWNGTNWARRYPNHTPPSRLTGHVMTYDLNRRRTVLYGGELVGQPGVLNWGIWEFDGIDWRGGNANPAPGPLRGAAAAYDSVRARTYVVCGNNGLVHFNTTWRFPGDIRQQTYYITGHGNGIGWVWCVDSPDAYLSRYRSGLTGNASVLTREFVKSINGGNCFGIGAAVSPIADNLFTITASGNQPFSLGFGTFAPFQCNCFLPPNGFCYFNPTVRPFESDCGDCNKNGEDDCIDLVWWASRDCNGNHQLDECDLGDGSSLDGNLNGVPDECEADCPCNGDADLDGDIDPADAAFAADCVGQPTKGPCGSADVDCDFVASQADVDAINCRIGGGTPLDCCPARLEACCLPDETCADVTYVACLEKNGIARGPGSACSAESCPACTNDGDCDDGSLCTLDTCQPSGYCSNVPIYNDVIDPEAEPSRECCNPITGVIFEMIDDGDPCTQTRCEHATGTVVHDSAPAGEACDDGDACTVEDTCDGAGVCAGTDLLSLACVIQDDCPPPGVCDEEVGVCVCPSFGCCLPSGECIPEFANLEQCPDLGGFVVLQCLGDANADEIDDACDTCTSCQLYADLSPPGGDCNVDVGDILCSLDCFSGVPPCSDVGDISPCGGDGFCDVGDVLAALDSFAGIYACPHPCPP